MDMSCIHKLFEQLHERIKKQNKRKDVNLLDVVLIHNIWERSQDRIVFQVKSLFICIHVGQLSSRSHEVQNKLGNM